MSHPDFVCENLSLKKKRKCGIKVSDIISNVFNQPTRDQCPFDEGFVNHDDDGDEDDDDEEEEEDNDDDDYTRFVTRCAVKNGEYLKVVNIYSKFEGW